MTFIRASISIKELNINMLKQFAKIFYKQFTPSCLRPYIRKIEFSCGESCSSETNWRSSEFYDETLSFLQRFSLKQVLCKKFSLKLDFFFLQKKIKKKDLNFFQR